LRKGGEITMALTSLDLVLEKMAKNTDLNVKDIVQALEDLIYNCCPSEDEIRRIVKEEIKKELELRKVP
jgi:hypothetical protein